jgi:hypothetical protein
VYRYLVGLVAGIVLTNAWNSHSIDKSLRRQAESVTIPAERVIEEVPESLLIFEDRQVYVIVRFDDDPRVAVVEPEWGRKMSLRFFSSRPELLGLEVGTRFRFDHNARRFIVLPKSTA